MPQDLSAFRERGKAHQAELDAAVRFLTPQQLAARWGMSVTAVKGIPYAELPYIEYGQGLKLKRRRYSPEAVDAYEHRVPARLAQQHAEPLKRTG